MLEVALDVEKSDCKISMSMGLRAFKSCSKFEGKLLLRSLPRCGKILVRLRRFSTDDAKLVKLFPVKRRRLVRRFE